MKRLLAIATAVIAFAVTTASPLAAGQQPAGRIRLAEQTTWLGAGGRFDIRLDLEGLNRPAQATVAVTVHGRVRHRSHFVQTIEGELTGGRTWSWPLSEIPFDAAGTISRSLPLPGPGVTAPDVLPDLDPGVYPVTVALQDGDDVLDSFVTHLVRLPDVDVTEPLAVAWIQPIGAAPSLRPDGDQTVPQDVLDGLRAVATALAAAPETVAVTLDPTPETIEALTVGDHDDVLELLRQGLERHQLLATPYVDVDPVALLADDLAAQLDTQRQVGEDALRAGLDETGDPRTWSARRPLTADALAHLRTLGVTQVILSGDALGAFDDDLTDGTTLVQPFAVADASDNLLDAVVADAGLTDHLTDGTDSVLAAHRLLADLAVLYFDLPGTTRGVVVQPPADWQPDNALLRIVLAGLATGRITKAATVDTLFDDIPALEDDGEAVILPLAGSATANALPADAIATAQRRIDELGAVTSPGNAEVAALRRLLLVGQRVVLADDQRLAYLDAVLEHAQEAQNRIRVLDGRRFRLTAREGTIPITLVNDNPFPVRIELVLSSEKLEFTDVTGSDRTQHVLPLDLEASATQTITVPVRARTSAAFPLQVTLRAPDGGSVISRGRITIVSTVFSGVGIVLSVGAGLVVLLWWARHWRTVRRDRRLVEPTQPPIT